jgi:hypothetical protein
MNIKHEKYGKAISGIKAIQSETLVMAILNFKTRFNRKLIRFLKMSMQAYAFIIIVFYYVHFITLLQGSSVCHWIVSYIVVNSIIFSQAGFVSI